MNPAVIDGPAGRPGDVARAPAAASATRIAAGALLRGDASLEPRLLVIEGPDAGRALRLRADQTVGRGRGADLRITDPAASRLHLRLSRVDGRFVAADLDSKNGLLVNDRPCLGARALEPGDELAIGATRLRLEPGLLERAVTAASPLSPTGEEGVRGRSSAAPPAPVEFPLSPTGGEGGVRGRHSGASLLAAAAALTALAAALLTFP